MAKLVNLDAFQTFCSHEYPFILLGVVDQKLVQKNHLSQLKYEDWKTLCTEVQKSAALEFLPNYEYYLYGAQASQVEHKGEKELHIVGYCPTIPEVYLRID